uniref:Mediator of RNA polymerase II transcription subunit 28 n=1 Tax=Rousettus aegyptiacus TaxID=9407 RepID=A0A7J8E8N8_ROUAE|nr:mediator complex subunit 28 [Rousettus aegyptiacus]
MAAPLGGMFSGQPPGPPLPPPGLPGQASLLQAAPGAPRSSPSTLVDELESSFEDVSELRNELQRKDALVQKHLTKLRHWQQVLEDVSAQHKKPADIPQGSLAYLEQASANIPAPMKQT